MPRYLYYHNYHYFFKEIPVCLKGQITYNNDDMIEQIEIKRKIFDVIEPIGERTKKVTRKNKIYFLKDFGNDISGFEKFVDSAHKLSVSGIVSPRIYVYDKHTHIVATEFIEGPTILDVLLEKDLPEEYFPLIFTDNWYMKNDNILLSFDPKNYKYHNGKLYYIPQLFDKYDEKKTFEKVGIWYWFYCREFVKYLEANNLSVDPQRANINQATINKRIALTVVKFYR